MSLKYKYSGITEDGSTQVIADGFDSKGRAFVSATRSAINLRCHINPRKFIRLEIQDDQGQPLDEYRNHDWLKCNTE